MKRTALVLLAALAGGCTLDSKFVKRGHSIHVTNQFDQIKACYSVGNVGSIALSLTPQETAAERTAQVGGDTAFLAPGNYVTAYVCDPDKIRAHDALEARVAKVRITNRQ